MPSLPGLLPISGGHSAKPDSLTSVGGGPRASTQARAEIMFQLGFKADFEDIRALGGEYDISTIIVDRQGSREIGCGMAFATGHSGMANTGLEAAMDIPMTRSIGTKYAKLIGESMDYKKRLRGTFENNVSDRVEMLKKENTVGAIMYKRALGQASHTPDGELDVSRAFAMRSDLGEDERENLEKLRQVAKKELHHYKLMILPNTEVTAIDLSDPKKPSIKTRSVKGSTKSKHLSTDTVRLNTGTTLANPIRDTDVRKITYSQPMNRTDMGRFLEKHGLLDVNGKLKEGARILSGGVSLSAYDQLSVLEKFMDLFEEDDSAPAGYKVSAAAKAKYQGAITLVSRTLRKIAVPRHSHTNEWQQATPAIGDTRKLHALYLHQNGEETFKNWPIIMNAAIARATGRTPIQVDPTDLSIEELAGLQYNESKIHLRKLDEAAKAERAGDMSRKAELLRESTQTLYGARRQAALSMIIGYGLEKSMEDATTAMSESAPITWMGRQGYLLHRAQLRSISDPRFASEHSNSDLFNSFDDCMRDVVGSPAEIHSMIAKLLEAGILKHVSGSYLDITAESSGKGVYLNGKNYDAFVISPVFTRQADPAVRSLKGQVKPVHDSRPEFGEVAKFRQVVSSNGKATNLEDYGLTGKGAKIALGDGSGSTVGAFAIDVNNRASAAGIATSLATRRMAAAHLAAAGFADPKEKLAMIYETQKPSEGAYTAEVQQFEKDFYEVLEICAYLKAIEMISGKDSAKFAALYDRGFSENTRKSEVETWSKSENLVVCEAAAEYEKAVSGKPKFAPPTRDTYLDRFVDATEKEDCEAYEEALKQAKRRLTKLGGYRDYVVSEVIRMA